ncbi:MAG: alkaline phosphatase [Anaerolineae bacterium]|nr:alkaline phosphatase [Anaerolineae bacterium]MDW8098512.1 alkaline phosphatase [Anaerolineae bacterium]
MRINHLRQLALSCITALLIWSTALPGIGGIAFAAQSSPPPVLILPVNNAQFLPGTYFDVRVEVHAEALPQDFAVTVNGVDANTFFGARGKNESWRFGPEDKPVPVQSVIWRKVMLRQPGEYKIEVTAGGRTTRVTWTVRQPQPGHARNVILFIADGMSVPMLTAARLVSRGNTQGKYNGYFALDQMEEIGLINTSGLDSIITDSANSASAYNTGHKAAMNAMGTYPDTSPDTLDDPRVETFAEIIKRVRNMAVGIVTTADWTDATPAAVFAHTRRRDERSFIAAEPLDEKLFPEVILGGGARYMLPKSASGSRRQDERDLFAEYEKAGYTVVTTATELAEAMKSPPKRLLGIFHPADMNVWLDRHVYTDNLKEFTDQPDLPEMTLAALQVLNQNKNGWYLMVEAASVDKQMHALDAERMIADIIEFDNAIAAALEWISVHAPDTLVIVTADHGHGYEVFGTVDVEAFNAAKDDMGRRNAIGVYDDAGFPTYEDKDGDFFPDTWVVTRTLAGLVNNHPDYTEDFQVSPVPRVPAIRQADGTVIDNPDDDPNGIFLSGTLSMGNTLGVHTLQDVPVFASGPGAAYFGRVMDNTEVFFGMAYAIGLDPMASDGKVACTGIRFGSRCYHR